MGWNRLKLREQIKNAYAIWVYTIGVEQPWFVLGSYSEEMRLRGGEGQDKLSCQMTFKILTDLTRTISKSRNY